MTIPSRNFDSSEHSEGDYECTLKKLPIFYSMGYGHMYSLGNKGRGDGFAGSYVHLATNGGGYGDGVSGDGNGNSALFSQYSDFLIRKTK